MFPSSRSIWTVYMRLPPTPLRPICMSRAAVANGALDRTSPCNVLPFLHTPIDGTPSQTNIPNQTGSRSNGNQWMTPDMAVMATNG